MKTKTDRPFTYEARNFFENQNPVQVKRRAVAIKARAVEKKAKTVAFRGRAVANRGGLIEINNLIRAANALTRANKDLLRANRALCTLSNNTTIGQEHGRLVDVGIGIRQFFHIPPFKS